MSLGLLSEGKIVPIPLGDLWSFVLALCTDRMAFCEAQPWGAQKVHAVL